MSTTAPIYVPSSTSSTAISYPSPKRLQATAPNFPWELSEYISRDVKLLSMLGWPKFAQQQ